MSHNRVKIEIKGIVEVESPPSEFIPPNLLDFAKHDVTGYALSTRTSPYQRKYKFKDGNVLCKCGHYIGIVGTKWQHKFDLTLIEYYYNADGEQMTHLKGKVDYKQKCYYCACIKPMPDSDKNTVG